MPAIIRPSKTPIWNWGKKEPQPAAKAEPTPEQQPPATTADLPRAGVTIADLLQAVELFLYAYNVKAEGEHNVIVVRAAYGLMFPLCTAWVLCQGDEKGNICLADPDKIKPVGQMTKADERGILLEFGSIEWENVLGTIKRI